MPHINDVVFDRLSPVYGVQPMTELLRLFWLDQGGHPCNELFNFYRGAGAVGEHVLDFEKNTFHSPGIYYFTIESAEYKSTLKMVKFD